MPPIRVYGQRSFAPFPIAYSSETFASLIRENHQISHIQYLLRGQHASLARFRHYLATCSTIFSLEQTLWELHDNRDHVFAEFVTIDTVNPLQPFLIQTCRRMHAPISITINTNTDSVQSQPASQQNRRRTPSVARIPHTHHDNAPLPITTPNPTPIVVRIPTPSHPPVLALLAMYLHLSFGLTLALAADPPMATFLLFSLKPESSRLVRG